MPEQDVPTGYDEIISVLASLPVLVREARRRRGLSMRAAAAEAGVLPTTVMRCEAGTGMHLASVVPLLRWVGRPDETTGGGSDA